jgi:hypothetical protein
MTEVVPVGPYMNEDGDWWVPVAGIAFRQARALVTGCLDDCRLAYLGKMMVWLDSEHAAGDCGSEECPYRRHVLAYHFEERRDDLATLPRPRRSQR